MSAAPMRMAGLLALGAALGVTPPEVREVPPRKPMPPTTRPPSKSANPGFTKGLFQGKHRPKTRKVPGPVAIGTSRKAAALARCVASFKPLVPPGRIVDPEDRKEIAEAMGKLNEVFREAGPFLCRVESNS